MEEEKELSELEKEFLENLDSFNEESSEKKKQMASLLSEPKRFSRKVWNSI